MRPVPKVRPAPKVRHAPTYVVIPKVRPALIALSIAQVSLSTSIVGAGLTFDLQSAQVSLSTSIFGAGLILISHSIFLKSETCAIDISRLSQK